MFRKVATASLALIVVAGVLIAAPASAAKHSKISNGVKCTKSGATTKTSTGSYKCGKNLLTTSKKLTWLSVDCIKITTVYKKANANLPILKTSTDVVIAGFESDIVAAQSNINAGLLKIAEYGTKIAELTPKLAAVKADTANLITNKKTIDNYQSAITNFGKAKTTYEKTNINIQRSITRIDNSKVQALAGYETTKADIADTLVMAKLVCGAGY